MKTYPRRKKFKALIVKTYFSKDISNLPLQGYLFTMAAISSSSEYQTVLILVMQGSHKPIIAIGTM